MTPFQALLQDAFILVVSVTGLIYFYEKHLIPARIEAARIHVLYQCSHMSGVDCAEMKPLIYKCRE